MRLCERGPAHERSECIGCSEAISMARCPLPGDCRVASLLAKTVKLELPPFKFIKRDNLQVTTIFEGDDEDIAERL
jgi:hypothetical protein